MNWRELMKVETPTQYPHNPQKGVKKKGFENIEDIEHIPEIKARGYGCGKCSNRIYRLIYTCATNIAPCQSIFKDNNPRVQAWQCEGCGAIFPIIGGSRGPQYIQ